MKANEILDNIMKKYRISNVLLNQITGINATTLCRYRKKQRNIGEKSFVKICSGLEKLEINSKILWELNQAYENSRYKKIS